MAKTGKMDKAEKTEKAPETPTSANGDSKRSSQKNGAKHDSKDDAKKERKQQAKRDAKLMLKIEQAKKDVQKAQQKVIKAQTGLNEAQGHLQELEEKMSSQKVVALLPAGSTESRNGHSEPAAMNETVESSSVPTEQASDATGVGEQENSQNTEGEEKPTGVEALLNQLPAEDTQIESNNGSMPLVTTDEHAWPPPLIREEVAEAAIEVSHNDEESVAEPGNESTSSVASQAETGNEGTATTPSDATHSTHHARHTRHTHSGSESAEGAEGAEHATQEVPESENTQLTEHYGTASHQQE